jgi:hypothetical protein
MILEYYRFPDRGGKFVAGCIDFLNINTAYRKLIYWAYWRLVCRVVHEVGRGIRGRDKDRSLALEECMWVIVDYVNVGSQEFSPSQEIAPVLNT